MTVSLCPCSPHGIAQQHSKSWPTRDVPLIPCQSHAKYSFKNQRPVSTGYHVATVRDLPRNAAPHASGRLRVHRDATRDLGVGTLPTSRPPLEAQVGDVREKYRGIDLAKSPSLDCLESVLRYSEVRGRLFHASPQHVPPLVAPPRKRPETHRILQTRTVGVGHTHELLSEKNSNPLDGLADFLVGEDRCHAYPTAVHPGSSDRTADCNRLFGADRALRIPRSTTTSWLRRPLPFIVSCQPQLEDVAVLRERIHKLDKRVARSRQSSACRGPCCACVRVLAGT